MKTCKAETLPIPLERDLIRQNIALPFVNGHVSKPQAGQAVAALESHWTELDTIPRAQAATEEGRR